VDVYLFSLLPQKKESAMLAELSILEISGYLQWQLYNGQTTEKEI
jgi:hypothetical protein